MADLERAARVEPWPLALALALLTSISVCIGFWWIATTHADVELTNTAKPPGLSSAGDANGDR